jgi:uncharacterized cupredoxin-like copper-binding protein
MSGRSAARATALAASALVVMVVLPACGGGESGGPVAITLQEFAVSADPASVPAGSVTFDVTNDGPDDVHEFVVIATDLGPTELPVDADGAVEEGGEGMEVVDEIEDIPVGESPTLTVDLEAGNYVLICNILQEEPNGTLEAHYAEGMRTGFTVE